MTSPQEKAKIVGFVHECGSIVQAERCFQRGMNKPAPERHSIQRWVDQFEATGSVLKGKSAGRPRKSNERVNVVLEVFIPTTIKSQFGKLHLS